jgi:hypothetical protein
MRCCYCPKNYQISGGTKNIEDHLRNVHEIGEVRGREQRTEEDIKAQAVEEARQQQLAQDNLEIDDLSYIGQIRSLGGLFEAICTSSNWQTSQTAVETRKLGNH